jgi:Protein of unknown function (DUF2695)
VKGIFFMSRRNDIIHPDNPRWGEFTEALYKSLGYEKLPGSCINDLSHATKVLTEMGNVDIEGTLEYCRDNGGFCDCEILFNVDRE